MIQYTQWEANFLILCEFYLVHCSGWKISKVTSREERGVTRLEGAARLTHVQFTKCCRPNEPSHYTQPLCSELLRICANIGAGSELNPQVLLKMVSLLSRPSSLLCTALIRRCVLQDKARDCLEIHQCAVVFLWDGSSGGLASEMKP